MLTDSHMHTHFSQDSDALPEQMVLSAVEKGLETICFTDHEDKDFVEEGRECVIDMPEYLSEIRRLQEKYQDRIRICLGVEIGLQPHLGEFCRGFTGRYPFDFVIGSVHVAGGKDPYFADFFEGRTDQEGYRFMLEETLKNVRMIPDFDVLGHLDYVVRYGKQKEKSYSYQEMEDLIEAILRELISRGKGLEVNTAGLKYGLPFAHPFPDVLKKYRELGGEIITVGADAHRPEHVGYAFDRIDAYLKDCGFKYYTKFVDRKPVFEKIR